MIGQTIAIARNTFLESVRQPIFFVLLMAGWILQIFNTMLSSYSLGYTDSSEVTGDNKLLLDIGLATVFVCATLLAAFIATAVLSREIENKTAMTVISKPVGRPMFVIGKYLGVTAAILVATVIMIVFFEFALRHRVMSTTRDKPDLPVIVFTLLAIGLSVGVGVWGNYFYGWVFSSTAVFVLLPASLLAWFGVMLLDKSWNLQPITTDLKPQVLLASACVLMAMPVLTAVAIAASTRLGQVMTLVVCAGAFMLGLLSNHLIGQRAFTNTPVASVSFAAPERDLDRDFRDGGDAWRITLKQPADVNIAPGDSIYYGPTPNGVALAVPAHDRFTGDPSDHAAAVSIESSPALVVRTVEEAGKVLTAINIANLPVRRPPAPNDAVFMRPTEINAVAWGAWAIVPNLQFFWLVDAVTQSHDIPARYVGLVALYSLVQITGLLALAVILFQTREVG